MQEVYQLLQGVDYGNLVFVLEMRIVYGVFRGYVPVLLC